MEWMLMPLRRYADFQGRSRRMEFWMFLVFQILLWLVWGILFMVIGGSAMFASGAFQGGEPSEAALATLGMSVIIPLALGVLLWLALLIPTIAVSVRRLHDSNKSGFWLLGYYALLFVQYGLQISAVVSSGGVDNTGSSGVGGLDVISFVFSLAVLVYAIVLLVFFFLPGTTGQNRFGPDPKGGTDFDVFS